MDNISKVRTLLHIAREALAYHINEAEQRHEKERLIRPDRDIVARIDAALAEPYNIPINEECSGEHGCANLGLGKNIWTPEYDYCDERNITHYPPCPLAYSQSDNDPAAFLGEGFVALLEEPVSDDYQRGAEAMREAAAQNCAGEVCARQIRALPIPEDK